MYRKRAVRTGTRSATHCRLHSQQSVDFVQLYTVLSGQTAQTRGVPRPSRCKRRLSTTHVRHTWFDASVEHNVVLLVLEHSPLPGGLDAICTEPYGYGADCYDLQPQNNHVVFQMCDRFLDSTRVCARSSR